MRLVSLAICLEVCQIHPSFPFPPQISDFESLVVNKIRIGATVDPGTIQARWQSIFIWSLCVVVHLSEAKAPSVGGEGGGSTYWTWICVSVCLSLCLSSGVVGRTWHDRRPKDWHQSPGSRPMNVTGPKSSEKVPQTLPCLLRLSSILRT